MIPSHSPKRVKTTPLKKSATIRRVKIYVTQDICPQPSPSIPDLPYF